MDTDELLAFEPDHQILPVSAAYLKRLNKLKPKERLEKLVLRRDLIQASRSDPYHFEFELDIWHFARKQIAYLRALFPKGVIKLIIFGGNRSSKSRFGGHHVVHRCVDNPAESWWCCDSTEAMARANQMRYIWTFIPPEYKQLPKEDITNIKYSQLGGFPQNMTVFPNKSEIAFKFYSMHVEDLPGPELNGVWADELIPLNWIDTLIYRLTNRNGLLLITFTPETGWTETVSHYVEGATVVETSEADPDLLPNYDAKGNLRGGEQVYRVLQCADPTARIIYFHTADNPFGNYPALKQELVKKKANRGEILVRAYGMAEKSAYAAFPRFHGDWHIITVKAFRELEKEFPDAERYQLIDPCSGRNWFIIYVFCPEPNRWIVYREWPSFGHKDAFIERVGDPGPWAVVGTDPDGKQGPAQKTFGFGLRDYKRLFEEMEKGEKITERWIDSSYARAPITGHESSTTLIEQLVEHDLDFRAMVAESRILHVKDGSIDMINTALDYDEDVKMGEFSGKLGRLNVPQLQIVETCPNVIYSLRTWTGEDGQTGASKDPIDDLRGLFLSRVGYMGEEMYTWQKG